jgi:lysophospholipase
VGRGATCGVLAALAVWTGASSAGAEEATALELKIRDRVLPFLAAGEKDTLKTEGGLELATFRAMSSRPSADGAPRDVVVVLEGYAEFYRLYGEVMLDLADFGYDVASFDFRGQGLSGRLVEPSDVGYVDSIGDYVEDLELFLKSQTAFLTGRRVHLLAHSTGGLVAAHYLAAHPETFSSVVLSAPYFRLNTGWLPEWFVLLTTRALGWIGRAAAFAPGQGKWTVDGASFETNKLTHSRERYAAWLGALRAEPALVIRGASNAWTAATVAATRQLEGLAPKMTARTLLLQAGEDHFVVNDGHEAVCGAMPRCEIVRYPTAYHELLQETDDVRSDALARIDAFLQRRD